MAYTPTEWKNGDVITAEKLNNIERGIENSGVFTIHVTADFNMGQPPTLTNVTVLESADSIMEAYDQGKIIVILAEYYQNTNKNIASMMGYIVISETESNKTLSYVNGKTSTGLSFSWNIGSEPTLVFG